MKTLTLLLALLLISLCGRVGAQQHISLPFMHWDGDYLKVYRDTDDTADYVYVLYTDPHREAISLTTKNIHEAYISNQSGFVDSWDVVVDTVDTNRVGAQDNVAYPLLHIYDTGGVSYPIWYEYDTGGVVHPFYDGKYENYRFLNADSCYHEIMVVDTVGWILYVYGDSLSWQQSQPKFWDSTLSDYDYKSEQEIYRVSYCRNFNAMPMIDTTYYHISGSDTVEVMR